MWPSPSTSESSGLAGKEEPKHALAPLPCRLTKGKQTARWVVVHVYHSFLQSRTCTALVPLKERGKRGGEGLLGGPL